MNEIERSFLIITHVDELFGQSHEDQGSGRKIYK